MSGVTGSDSVIIGRIRKVVSHYILASLAAEEQEGRDGESQALPTFLIYFLICMWICMCLSLGSGMVWYIVKNVAVLRIMAQEICTKLLSVETNISSGEEYGDGIS